MSFRYRYFLLLLLAVSFTFGPVMAEVAESELASDPEAGDSESLQDIDAEPGGSEVEAKKKKKDVYVARKKQRPVRLILGGHSEGGRAKQVTMPVGK